MEQYKQIAEKIKEADLISAGKGETAFCGDF